MRDANVHEVRAAAMRADAMRSLVPLYAALDGVCAHSDRAEAGDAHTATESVSRAEAITARKLHDGSPLPRGIQR